MKAKKKDGFSCKKLFCPTALFRPSWQRGNKLNFNLGLIDILDQFCVLLKGLSKDKDRRENVKNSLWVYNINKNKW